MAPWPMRGAVFAAAAATLAAACSGPVSAAQDAARVRDLTVAVVPAVDSAGFFIALYDHLFARQRLDVRFIPAVSSQTEINLQAEQLPARDPVEISCGAYPSYLTAQQNWDAGQRPNPAHPDTVAADLYLFAEGSIMTPGAQDLYVMPGRGIATLADLEGKTVGVNAPGNILYLLVAAALAGHGLSVSGVKFAYIPLPQRGLDANVKFGIA
jgi:NitT/TauT family transport system substrate-binding protein